MKSVPLLQNVRGQNHHTDDGSQPGGKYGSENSHAAGKDEYPVQHHIGKAASDHGSHSPLRSSVVSGKAQEHIVHQKRGREQKNYLQIGIGHLINPPLGAEQPQDCSRGKQTQQHKKQGKSCCQIHSSGERPVCLLVIISAFADGISGSPSHTDHQAASMDEAVNGNSQIQGCQAIRSQPLRHEKGVRQYVAGQSDHPHYVQGHIFSEIPDIFFTFHQTLPPLFFSRSTLLAERFFTGNQFSMKKSIDDRIF